MEYLSILNVFGQSYLSQMKEEEHEAACFATLTSKFCGNTHKQQPHYKQLHRHNSNINKSTNCMKNFQIKSPSSSSSSLLSSCSPSKSMTTSTTTSVTTTASISTTVTSTLMLQTSLPSPPASRTSSTTSLPINATIAATTPAAAAAAVLHLQQLQKHQQHLQNRIEAEQKKKQQHLLNHHHHDLLQHHAQQQQQQQKKLHPHHNHLQQQNNSHVANSLLWQPWRDLQHAAAVHHRLYQQQLRKEARLSAKELPTAKWRRGSRMRTAEYHTSPTSGMISSPGATSTSSSPPPIPTATGSPDPLEYVLPSVPHDISSVANVGVTPPAPSTSPHAAPISMMVTGAAAGATNMRPLCESTNRIITSGAGASVVNTSNMIIGSMPTVAFIPQYAHQHVLAQHQQLFAAQQQSMESPLDMSVSSSNGIKKRSSPPPPYREPLPGSSYATSLPRPSVITQAPSKRGIDSGTPIGSGNQIQISNRENENSSAVTMCENVIDEHFRRSLGADYAAIFGGKRASPAPSSNTMSTPSPQPTAAAETIQLTNTPPPQVSPQAISVHNAHHSSKHHQVNQLGMQPPSTDYHLALPTSRPLISPKPATELLSPTAAAAYIKEVHPPNAPSPSPLPLLLIAPQQQPLSLHRSASNSPCSPASPQPLNVSTTNNGIGNNSNNHTKGNQIQRLPIKRHASPSPLPSPSTALRNAAAAAESPLNQSPMPSPSHSPPIGVPHTNSAVAPIVMPAIMRIKAEPSLPPKTTASTPQISPNSQSNASNSDVMASVDDHFAKALGDTWKKLQERK